MEAKRADRLTAVKWLLMGIGAMTTLAVIAGAVAIALPYVHGTQFVFDSHPRFAGIKSYLEKDETGSGDRPRANVLVIHGISEHCLGYSDALIGNLASEIAPGGASTRAGAMAEAYQSLDDRNRMTVADSASNSGGAYPPLRGDCSQQYGDAAGYLKHLGIDAAAAKGSASAAARVLQPFQVGDLRFTTMAQASLCNAINAAAGGLSADRSNAPRCYQLGVMTSQDQAGRRLTEPQYYPTGFVRVTQADNVRFFELVWSPATRWIKKRLIRLDHSNQSSSAGLFNQSLKSGVVNSAIADAVAYLSEPGVLINFNVLQAFCLSIVDELPDPGELGRFTCDQNHLAAAHVAGPAPRIFLISHSLGTRVMFDSLGMLASDRLVPDILKRLDAVGAIVPGEYSGSSQAAFAELLSDAKLRFLGSIDAIYAFTNQVPLLSANLTSPFRLPSPEVVGEEFQAFISKRAEYGRRGKLQIVSFHDPDDLLSYRLGCWYYLSHLRGSKAHGVVVDAAREGMAKKGQSVDNRQLLDALKRTYCDDHVAVAPANAGSQADWQNVSDGMRDSLEDSQPNVAFVDASVRIKTFRVPMVLASPMGVHSNYYHDEDVHGWITHGTF